AGGRGGASAGSSAGGSADGGTSAAGAASLDAGADGSLDASILPPDGEAPAPAEAGTDGSSATPDASTHAEAYDGTIYAIQRPDSVIATGSHVVIDNAAIQVTGVFTDVFFMQEAESSHGRACDWPFDEVVYRGIAVQPLAFDATLP